jgi:molybdate transport system regulatory protein
MDLKAGVGAVLLINSYDILISSHPGQHKFSATNSLPCNILRIHFDEVNAETIVRLKNGATLSIVVTKESAQLLGLTKETEAWALFKSNAPILGIKS